MTEQKKVEREGAGVAETSDIAAYPAPGRRRRLMAARKREAVLRVLRGEDVDLVAGLRWAIETCFLRAKDDLDLDRVRGTVGIAT